MEATLTCWIELMQLSLSPNLPNEIMIEILVRLPVKSIIRFKCINKLWYSFLSQPKFAEMHLLQSLAKRECLLIRHLVHLEKELTVWRSLEVIEDLEVDMLNTSDSSPIDPDTYELMYSGTVFRKEENYSLWSKEGFEDIGRLEVPVQSDTSYYSLVGSCNGLVCLTQSNFSSTYHYLNTFLWNPATKEIKALPRYTVGKFTSSIMVVGLGFTYLPEMNDYKVIRIIYFIQERAFEVETYSLSTDCWTKVDAAIQDCYFHDHLSQVFTNGAMHWLVTTNIEWQHHEELILAFDVYNDKFNMIELPEICYPENNYLVCKILAVVEGSLAMFTHMPFHERNGFDIWALKEYGSAKSWTKVYSIPQTEELLLPLQFVGNGTILMKKSNSEVWVLCDSQFNKIKDLQTFIWGRVVNYAESLISLKGGSGTSAKLIEHGSTSDLPNNLAVPTGFRRLAEPGMVFDQYDFQTGDGTLAQLIEPHPISDPYSFQSVSGPSMYFKDQGSDSNDDPSTSQNGSA